MTHEHVLKVSRLEGLTDGVFAIAMTILVLNLQLPIGLAQNQMAGYLTLHILERLFVYAGSFIILGTLWIAMSFQIGLIERLNRQYLWMHVLYLMIICVVPFSANLLAAYRHDTSSILFYSINLLFASAAQIIIAQCAYYYRLNKDIYSREIHHAILRRVLVAPPFYFIAIVAAYWNVRLAFIALLIPNIVYMIPGRVDRYDN
jgi:uncharacterized membrane protein